MNLLVSNMTCDLPSSCYSRLDILLVILMTLLLQHEETVSHPRDNFVGGLVGT